MRIGMDEFLLGVAGVSATLIGTFLVGVFFYIDTDLHRRLVASEAADRYLRSGASTALVVNQWTSTAAVVALVALPWIIGGWVPPASAFVPSILLALAAGFASTAALIMTEFDATAGMVEFMEEERAAKALDERGIQADL